MILYHGTNSNINNVIDSPKLTQSLNGLGFYLTNDIEVAKKYGRNIIAYDITGFDLPMTIRPIDLSYLDGLSTYEECVKGGIEYVVTTQSALDTLTLDICGEEVWIC